MRREEKRLDKPVGIVKNDHISGGKIDSKTTSTGREHEDELLRARAIVLLNGLLPLFMRGLAVKTAVLWIMGGFERREFERSCEK